MTEDTKEHDTNKKVPTTTPAREIAKHDAAVEATNGEDPSSAATAEAVERHTTVTEPTQSKDGQ